MKNLQELRDEFEAQIKEYRDLLDWMDEGDVRHFRREGNTAEMVDITDEIRADHQCHIDTYEELIKQLDEIAKG